MPAVVVRYRVVGLPEALRLLRAAAERRQQAERSTRAFAERLRRLRQALALEVR